MGDSVFGCAQHALTSVILASASKNEVALPVFNLEKKTPKVLLLSRSLTEDEGRPREQQIFPYSRCISGERTKIPQQLGLIRDLGSLPLLACRRKRVAYSSGGYL